MSTPSGPGRPAPPQARRHVMSTGTALFLIALGATLRFAFATTSTHGLNVHVVGVILILIGVIGLVLSLVMSSPLNPRRVRPRPLNARRLSLLIRPRDRGKPGPGRDQGGCSRRRRDDPGG